ncbi:hypothetical protein NECAME_11571 [Necator americanus]|uniref:Uncharacterized protein n=1 Tax=Necator americanus TaxID=51031 RepID=W2T6H5_NECAM|nr:hypothetical protein NECAME_11571 [Necator americanus]ETN76592.1 hypothetical protein NECAME_11571 [Necator americanus]
MMRYTLGQEESETNDENPEQREMNMRSAFEKAWAILRLQFYVIYLALQWIYQKTTEIIRVLNGTAEIPDGKVRMLSIMWRHKLDPDEIEKRQDFVLGGGHFESVELLNNSHWAMYTIEKDYVLFVLLPEPIYSYNISEYPFIFVPIPGVSVCYGEFPALTVLAVALGEGFMNENEVRELLHATITCLRAHLPTGVLCILKTQCFEARLVPLCEGVPNLKHIFMFRKKALLSVEKATRRQEFLYLPLLELYNYSPFLSQCIGSAIAADGRWIRLLHPHNMRIGIPLSCIPEAVECKKTDSQEGSFLSSQKLTHIKLCRNQGQIRRHQYYENTRSAVYVSVHLLFAFYVKD